MAVNVPLNEHGVTQQEENYAQAFIKLGQKTLAMKAAYDCSKYKPQSIGRAALKIHQRPRVTARIEQLKAQIATELIAHQVAKQEPVREIIYGALQVFQHWQDIALADPLKVVTHRRICCRYCHGIEHRYQWRDQEEFAVALADVMDANAKLQRHRERCKSEAAREDIEPDAELPSDDGGYGFRYNAKPHADCPRCLGEGSSDVLVHDLEKLGPRERRLIKSVRMKKGDVEVVMHDQTDALANMAKSLGMLVEKVKFVDPNEKTDMPALPLDPTEASRVYAEMLKSS